MNPFYHTRSDVCRRKAKKLRPVCRNKPPPTEKFGREKGSPNIYDFSLVNYSEEKT
jgi:hypothetical protein